MAAGSEAQEVLVVLGPSADREAVVRLAPIVHSASDRVFAVRGDSAQVARIRQLPGVTQVLTGEEPEDATHGLSGTEELFARAWLMARQPKQRKGQGLPWDTPGYLPPDPKR